MDCLFNKQGALDPFDSITIRIVRNLPLVDNHLPPIIL